MGLCCLDIFSFMGVTIYIVDILIMMERVRCRGLGWFCCLDISSLDVAISTAIRAIRQEDKSIQLRHLHLCYCIHLNKHNNPSTTLKNKQPTPHVIWMGWEGRWWWWFGGWGVGEGSGGGGAMEGGGGGGVYVNYIHICQDHFINTFNDMHAPVLKNQPWRLWVNESNRSPNTVR